MSLALVLLWLHVLAAIAWIGGMLFLGAVLAPATRALPEAERTALFGLVGPRLRLLGWGSIAVLLVTGVGNVLVNVPSWAYLSASRAGPLLAVKLLFVASLIAMSIVHDFVYGPRQIALSAQARAGQATPEQRAAIERLRRRVRLLGQISLVLGLAVVLIGVSLRFAW